MTSKIISCGVLLYHVSTKSLLLGHVTGQDFWDIPKGNIQEGESYLEGCLRECYEETGIVLDTNKLIDLGLFSYRKGKSLYLFLCYHDFRYDTNGLTCSSYFGDGTRPELDQFAYISLESLSINTRKHLYRVISTIDIENGKTKKKKVNTY